MMKKQITARVTEEDYNKLDKISIKEDRSINYIVTKILAKYLSQIKCLSDILEKKADDR